MKTLVLFLCVALITQIGMAQNVAVNNSGTSAHSSAILDISSNNKGVLVPRMMSIERTGIQNPANGLLVYDLNSNSFWFYSNGWQQLGAGSGSMSGPAGGDLSGVYPTPNVAKLQNLDVAPGVPFDKQVLKWDAIAGNWKGRRDSLFLPNIATSTYAGPLFGITNNSSEQGSSAILGKRGAGIGIVPGTTMGVWGDNNNGIGVLGTSNNGVGVYGLSSASHGVYGYSITPGWAGIRGSHAGNGGIAVHGDVGDGIGVMGEIQTDGTAVYGKVNGEYGKAASFQTISNTNTDTTVTIKSNGTGTLQGLHISNATNTNPAIDLKHQGMGDGIKSIITNTNSFGRAIYGFTNGQGTAVHGKSEFGITAMFENTNVGNGNPALLVNSASNDHSFVFNSTNTTNYNPAMMFNHAGQGEAMWINVESPTNQGPAVKVETAGNRGVEILTHGLHGLASVTYINEATAVYGGTGQTANSAVAVKGVTGANTSGCIGVLGEAGVNDPLGIGVKGIAGNVGVHGEATALDGVGVYGRGVLNMNSSAAKFDNHYTNNTSDVVQIFTNGKGSALRLLATSVTNDAPMFHISSSGTGQFLRFQNNAGDVKTTISNTGNMTTDGTVTVKGDKGIVRNSSGTQLRVETVTAAFDTDADGEIFSPLEAASINVTFSTPFSSPPAVYVANIVLEGGGTTVMVATVKNVNSSGCTLNLMNPTNQNIVLTDSTWKLVAMGAE